MDKIYRVQMNSKGMPNFSTAVEVADRPQEWIPLNTELPIDAYDIIGYHKGEFKPDTFMVIRKGADDETD